MRCSLLFKITKFFHRIASRENCQNHLLENKQIFLQEKIPLFAQNYAVLNKNNYFLSSEFGANHYVR